MDRSVDELWLHCQQRLTAHLAHDLKGALNGVSVNMEVVRRRAGRPEADIAGYANSAVEQLESVIKMTVALLSLGREIRGQAEVSTITKQLAAVVEDTMRSDGAKLDLSIEGGVSGATSAPPPLVRLILAEAMLAAALRKTDVSVRIRATAGPRIEIKGAGLVELEPDLVTMVTEARIVVQTDGHGISIVFPSPSESRTEEA